MLAVYLGLTKNSYALPEGIFWVSVLGAQLLLFTQTAAFGRRPGMAPVILLQGLCLATLVRLFLQPPGAILIGFDGYAEVSATEQMASLPWAVRTIENRYEMQLNYPGLHLLTLATSFTSGLDILLVAKWLPFVFTLATPLLVYGIGRQVTGSYRAGLFAALSVSSLYMYLLFHAMPVREAFAFPLFLAIILAYSSSAGAHRVRMRALALIGLVIIPVMHHLTPFLMIMLFAVRAFWEVATSTFTTFARRSWLAALQPAGLASGQRLSWVLLFLIVAGPLAYWSILHYSPIDIFAIAAREALSAARTRTSGELPGTLRYNLLWWLQLSSSAAVGLTGLIGAVWLIKARKAVTGLTFLTYGGILGLASFMAFKGLLLAGETTAMASRFELFGFTFLLIAAGYACDRLLRWKSLAGSVVIGVFMLVAFTSYYRLPPYLITNVGTHIDWDKGETRLHISEAEWYTAAQLPPTGDVLSDDWLAVVINRMAVRPDGGISYIDQVLGGYRACSVLAARLEFFDYALLGQRSGAPLRYFGFDEKSLLEAGYLDIIMDSGEVRGYRVRPAELAK
jgi:hypothetical protein